MIRIIEENMGDTTFPFTTELLKDSLRLYLSAYGQIAENEVMTFDACDCIDERRRKPLYHDPCEKVKDFYFKIFFFCSFVCLFVLLFLLYNYL